MSVKRHLFQKSIFYAILFSFAIICIAPFWIMLVNSTRTNNEINTGVSVVPGTALIQNFESLVLGRLDQNTGNRFEPIRVPEGFLNSFIIALSSTLLTAYFATMTGYAFASFKFRGRKFLFAIILGIMMVPSSMSLIGNYKLIVGLDMIDTWWPLILPAIANPFAVFFLRNYLHSSLPHSLLEAARIDGASEIRIFHQIVLPLSTPAIASISIFGFLANWNSYLLPLLVLNTDSKKTLPIIIQQLNTTTYNRDLGALYAGVAISVVPILLIFIFFNRYIINGLNAGSVKE